LWTPGGRHRSGAHLAFDVGSLRVDLFERGKIVIVDLLAVSRVTREAPLAEHGLDVRAVTGGRRRATCDHGRRPWSLSSRSAPRSDQDQAQQDFRHCDEDNEGGEPIVPSESPKTSLEKKMEPLAPARRFTLRVLRLLASAKRSPTAVMPTLVATSEGVAKLDAPGSGHRYVRVAEMDANDESLEDRIVAHTDALYGLAKRLTSGSADAEDLVQETLIRALRAAPRLPDGGHLKAWLFRILRNAFYDLHRSERHHRDVDVLDEDQAAVDTNWLRGDAELDRLRGVVALEIEEATAKLGHESKTVLLLDVEGFTEAEIAGIMDCPIGTVKSRLMRARMNLRKLLSQYAK
jgi:RNA polymerase sigma-70 factor (ECF subfamily)